MQELKIEPGKTTLGVQYDPVNHVLEFSGSSYPSNPAVFFNPLIDWVKNYISSDHNKLITLVFKLKYFNTSSSHFLFKVLEMFSDLDDHKNRFKILYYHETGDDDSLDSWKSLIYDLDLKYEIIPYERTTENAANH